MNRLLWRVDNFAGVGIVFAISYSSITAFNSSPITVFAVLLLATTGFTEAFLLATSTIAKTTEISVGSIVAIICAILGSYSFTSNPEPLSSHTYFVSAWLILFYSLYLMWSYLTIRQTISIFPAFKKLINTGPYGYIRHPIYSAYIHIALCILISFPNFTNILAFVLMTSGLLARIYFEEKHLRLYKAYNQYADGVLAKLLNFPLSSPLVLLVITRMFYDLS